MAIPFIGVAIKAISGLGSQWMKNRGEVAAAKHTRRVQVIQGAQDWENQAMENAQSSWADEWLTLIFSIPLIGSFIPSMVPHILAGFEALKSMPDWYQYTLSIIVAASFGVRSAIGWNKQKEAHEVIKRKQK